MKPLLLIFLFAISISACDNQQKPSKKSSLSETKLYKIDRDIATSKMIFDSNVKMSCLTASIKDKVRSTNTNSYLDKAFAEDAAICTLYQSTEDAVSATYRRIEEAGSVGGELYFFKILVKGYDEKENRIHNDELIGFFESIKDCEKYRDIAIKLDIPNKGCKRLSGNPLLE